MTIHIRDSAYADLPYRPGVGIVLFNTKGQIFIAQRIDNPDGYWQFPQGGIEEGEDIIEAVFREMEEEIGTRNATILHELDEWLYYDIPDYLIQKLWDQKYRGQKQKWVALRFDGADSEIDLNTFEEPEFSKWKWADLKDIPELAVPFKREIYQKVIDRFIEISKQP